MLRDVGATVLEPVGTAEDAKRQIATGPIIDAVLQDTNLRGEPAFDVAETLQEQAIPFLFVTGYDKDAIPDRRSEMPMVQKPVEAHALVALIRGIVRADEEQPAG